MTFEKIDHPDQLLLTEILERPATAGERQRAYREKQRKLGRKQFNILVTDEERAELERVLSELRQKSGAM